MAAVWVFDFDDILFPLSGVLYSRIRKNWRVFSRWFNDIGEVKFEELQKRNMFRINEWLIKDEYKSLTPGQYADLQLKVIEKYRSLGFSGDFYSEGEPTDFARKTIMSDMFLENPNVKDVYILSRNVTEDQSISKMKFIASYMNHPKIHYINVNKDERKIDSLIENNIKFDVFIDDEIPNIREIAEKLPSLEGKEFMVPEYGYNKIPNDLRLLIEGKKGKITTYDPFKK